MKVCARCRKEMKCEKNGIMCVFGDAHVYPGDLYKCTTCEGEFIVCNANPIYCDKSNINKDVLIEMLEG